MSTLIVPTSRFGAVSIDATRVIVFPKGLLGFPDRTRFCLIEPADDACFFWLQSCDDPSLAFVVTDPAFFVEGYPPAAESEEVLVNATLTGNLRGPLHIDRETKVGEQRVLAAPEWTTRYVLVRLARGGK